MSVKVSVDNVVRAETDKAFASIVAQAGGVNRWFHYRVPTPLDNQVVLRMNRDTLYSAAVVDVSGGATFTLPDVGERYLSMMVIDQDHYIDQVVYEPGVHVLDPSRLDTPYVLVCARTLVDAADPDDIAAVNAIQDQMTVTAAAAEPYPVPDYDAVSWEQTVRPVVELYRGMADSDRAFGRRGEVDPVRHLIGTVAGWGGLPETEATYVNVDPALPVGEYSLTVRDVPVDAFWSISLYDADGYFPDTGQRVSLNNLAATTSDDGSVTVRFGGPGDQPNTLGVVDGWNYLVRLYRPRPEILDGSWSFPTLDESS